jgi:hypothetical protein
MHSLILIGTAHGEGVTIPLPADLSAAASTIVDPTPEQRFLTQAALLHAYLQAGRKPIVASPMTPAVENDLLPTCTPAAAELLLDLLRENSQELIAAWLAAAARTSRRAPHRVIPDLLEMARKNKAMRGNVVAAIDRRGRWVMSQNADWQFAALNFEIDESIWETGNPEQRLALLQQVRKLDPPGAAALLQKTWKDDPADQRTNFVKVFASSLGAADEPLLESMLDDRSKQVRAAAADLLGRLAGSQLQARMTARLLPLLVFKRGLMRNLKLEVTLPADLDLATQRDGIEKTPPPGTGEKQWWLQQLLSFAPVSNWTTASGLAPADFILLAAKTEFADAILQGLKQAAERQLDPTWIDPLLRHDLATRKRLNRVLLSVLPAVQFLGLAADVLRARQVGLIACSDLINNDNVALDVSSGRLWIQTVADLARSASREDLAVLYHLPGQCAMRIAPVLRTEIESRWNINDEPWKPLRSAVEKLLRVLEIRERIDKEFSQ